MGIRRWAAIAFLLLAAGLRAQDRDPVRDTLSPSVKVDVRRSAEQLPGTFITDLSALRGKALSPVGENDPVKFAMTLPGVASGAEGFSAFFARGGNLGNNLFTLDGVRIYGFSHLLGLTTAVPDAAFSSMAFCIGGFDGETGGMTASHIALSSPRLDYQSLHASASLSTTFASASVSAPIWKDRASILVAGRWSPFGLTYGLLKNSFDRDGRMPSLRMGVWDAYTKAGWAVAPGHELSVSCFGSSDGYDIGFPGTSYDLGWNNLTALLSYRWDIGRTTLRADVSYNRFRNRMEHAATVGGDANLLLLQSVIAEQNYSLTAEHRFLEGRIRLSEGLKHQRSRMSPAAAKTSESSIGILEDVPFTENVSHPTLTSGFIQLDCSFGPVDLMANARGNHYRNNAERRADAYSGFAWEASGRARWRIVRWLALELTYDNRVQFNHTLEGTPLGWSMDVIVPVTRQLPPERAEQGYAGLSVSFPGHTVTAGGFMKRMQNLVYYTDAKALFSAAAYGWSDNAQVGNGTSHGAELCYDGNLPMTGLSWNFAYTWSKTDRSFPGIDGGTPFPARYDRRHVLNAGVRWKGISATFTLQSGHWETVAAGQFMGYLANGEPVQLNWFSHPNNWQMPPYIRLDLGYSRDITAGRLTHSFTVGVFNVLNRHNPSMLAYDSTTKTWNLVSLFPIMPSLKYSLAF